MEILTVFDDLVRLETILWNELDARLRGECDVTLGSLNVLQVIERTAECRVQEVAGALAITVGGASQAVDRLERKQLCVRTPHPRNRRSSVLELTEAGRLLTADGSAAQDRHLRELLGDHLPVAEREQFAATLQRLRSALQNSAL